MNTENYSSPHSIETESLPRAAPVWVPNHTATGTAVEAV